MIQRFIKQSGSATLCSVLLLVAGGIWAGTVTQQSSGQQGERKAAAIPHGAQSTRSHTPDADVNLIVILKQPSAYKSTRYARTSKTGKPSASTVRSKVKELAAVQSGLLQTLKSKQLISRSKHQFSRLINGIAVTAKAGDIKKIASQPDVESVVVDHPVELLLETSVEQIGADEVWLRQDDTARNVTGQGVTVAVIDTGIDYSHPDLGGCFGEGCKVIGGYDFVNDDADPMDDDGHGTLVAGVVAANGAIKGVAPDANLYAYKALDENGSGFTSSIIAGIESAIATLDDPAVEDVDVINLSLRASIGSDVNPLNTAVTEAVAAGIVVVVAAGNSGPSLGTVESPGNAIDVITVGAIDKAGILADFSSRGGQNGHISLGYTASKPELLAPGVNINSTAMGGGYGAADGTSLAAPHVSGAAALLIQAHSDLGADEIKSLLVNNTTAKAGSPYEVGNGIVDVAAAHNASFVVSPSTAFTGYVESDTGSVDQQFSIKNISDTPLTIDLADSGVWPSGVTSSLSQSQLVIGPGEQSSIDLSLTLNSPSIAYRSDLRNPYYSTLNVTAAGQSVVVPVVFQRAELLELSFSNEPVGSYALQAWVFDNDLVQFSAARFGESSDAVVRFLTRGQPVNIILNDENSGTFYSRDDYSQSHVNPVLFNTSEPIYSAIVTAPNLDIERGSENLLISHPDFNRPIVDYVHESLGVDFGKIKFAGTPGRFVFDYLFFANTVAESVSDQVFFVNSERMQGAFSNIDITLSKDDGKGLELLFNDYRQLESGVQPLIGLAYYMNGAPWRQFFTLYGQDVYSQDPFRITFYGSRSGALENLLPAEGFLRMNFVDQDLGDLVTANEMVIDSLRHRKLLRSQSDEMPITTAVDRSNTHRVFIGLGPKFITSQLTKSDSGFLAWPNQNGLLANSVVMDSWGNTYTGNQGFKISCTGESPVLVEGELRHSDDLAFIGGCSDYDVLVSYETFLQGQTYASNALIQLSAAEGDVAPRLEMLELIDKGLVSHYVGSSDGQVRLKIADDGQVSSVKLELNTDSGAWQELTLTEQDGWHIAALPDVAGSSVAALRITAEDDDGNRLTNTINGAFMIGNGAASVIDSDGDGVNDADDFLPYHPLRSETAYKVSDSNATNATVSSGASDVVVQRFQLANEADAPAELMTLTVEASGDGDDAADISAVKLYVDVNGDGQLDSGDSLLATESYQQDNGELTFDLADSPYLLDSGVTDFLITYDF